MKPLKILFTSDTHIGLKTDEIDRTDEILKAYKTVITKAAKYKKEDKYEVLFVIGGDIFNTNTPSEANIGAFIKVMGWIKKINLKTYIIAGNHDSVADPDRLSCLGFVRKAKSGYPMINLIEDIKFLEYGVYDTGPLCFTFLPHITRSVLFNKIKDNSIHETTTTQEYIEGKCDRILTKVGPGSQHIVFSHLNVRGAHGGSEENLLKKSEAYLPSAFTNTPIGFIEPNIVQAHIHCLSEDTEVLTDMGWKHYTKIEDDDLFLTRNLKTGRDEWRKKNKIIVSDYKGKMIHLANSVVNQVFTPNHKILSADANNKNLTLKAFNEITRKINRIPVTSNMCGTGIDLSDDMIKLLIWVTADGNFDPFSYGIRIKVKKQRKVDALFELFGKLDIDFSYNTDNGLHKFRIAYNSDSGRMLFKYFNPKQKLLPEILEDANEDQANLILDTYAITDGNYQKGNTDWVQISSVKKAELDLLQEIFFKNGISSKIIPKKGEFDGERLKQPWIMSVNRNRSFVETHLEKSFKEIDYNGKIWCLDINNHNFVIRRNGCVSFTGNSHQIINNINIVGSPLYCTFGETGDKYYCEITHTGNLSEDTKIDFIPLDAVPFKQLEINMVGETKDFFKISEIVSFIDTIDKKENAVVRLDITINPENNTYDWKEIRKKIAKLGCYCKPITPRVVFDRPLRSAAQKINLTPKKAIQVYLKKNFKKNPTKMKRLYATALKYL